MPERAAPNKKAAPRQTRISCPSHHTPVNKDTLGDFFSQNNLYKKTLDSKNTTYFILSSQFESTNQTQKRNALNYLANMISLLLGGFSPNKCCPQLLQGV